MKKVKKKPWDELKQELCPRCGGILTADLFEQGLLGCSCSFEIKKDTKDILVNRDNNGK